MADIEVTNNRRSIAHILAFNLLLPGPVAHYYVRSRNLFYT